MRAPTVEEFYAANRSHLIALRLPLIWVSQETLQYVVPRFAQWYKQAHHDFDRDCYLYALLPLVPFVKLWAFWRRNRWIIERTLRYRIFIVREGYHCSEWKLAPLRKWGWKRDWRRMAAP